MVTNYNKSKCFFFSGWVVYYSVGEGKVFSYNGPKEATIQGLKGFIRGGGRPSKFYISMIFGYSDLEFKIF